MAKAFRPHVSYTNKHGDILFFSVKTYAEVKKNMKKYMKDSANQFVSVGRHRRGNWGEWYEHWEMYENKPMIIAQGWL